jgi:hypothetical protein
VEIKHTHVLTADPWGISKTDLPWMGHVDAASMTKCSEVKPRARIITDDAE